MLKKICGRLKKFYYNVQGNALKTFRGNGNTNGK